MLIWILKKQQLTTLLSYLLSYGIHTRIYNNMNFLLNQMIGEILLIISVVTTGHYFSFRSQGAIWLPSHKPLTVLSNVQYIPRNMHTVFALLCIVVVIHWLISPYPPGLLHWHCGNLTIAPVPANQPWWIWINTSCEFIMNDCITTTKQSTTKPCAYFLGYTVVISQLLVPLPWSCMSQSCLLIIMVSKNGGNSHIGQLQRKHEISLLLTFVRIIMEVSQ